MNTSSLPPVAAELVERHGCHTVILYGSRARGDHQPESDYDVLGIRADGPPFRDARPWQGGFLDAFIAPESDFVTLDDSQTKLSIGVVLCQRDNFGADLVARAQALAARPVAPLAADDMRMREVWHDKMLSRIRGRDAHDVEAHYRRAWLLFQILEDYFAFLVLPYRGPKEAFQWLAAHDPAADQAFRAALVPGASLEVIGSLVALVKAAAGVPSDRGLS